jgi:hypothetical protein
LFGDPIQLKEFASTIAINLVFRLKGAATNNTIAVYGVTFIGIVSVPMEVNQGEVLTSSSLNR